MSDNVPIPIGPVTSGQINFLAKEVEEEVVQKGLESQKNTKLILTPAKLIIKNNVFKEIGSKENTKERIDNQIKKSNDNENTIDTAPVNSIPIDIEENSSSDELPATSKDDNESTGTLTPINTSFNINEKSISYQQNIRSKSIISRCSSNFNSSFKVCDANLV